MRLITVEAGLIPGVVLAACVVMLPATAPHTAVGALEPTAMASPLSQGLLPEVPAPAGTADCGPAPMAAAARSEVDASPTNTYKTPYGYIGKWMLQAGGSQIANWGGQQHDSKGLYEPVNLILIDRTSTSTQHAINKLTAVLTKAGFLSRLGHTGGFSGRIGNTVYKQQPDLLFAAYSDTDCLLGPNNHGRAFGPAPASDGRGFIWCAAFSRERLDIYNGLPAHVYASFNFARDTLHKNLVVAGATDLRPVRLDNAINTPTITTGDHDGYAAAVEIT